MADVIKGVLKYKMGGKWIPIQSILGATGPTGPGGGGGGDVYHKEFKDIDPNTVDIFTLATILRGY